MHTCGSCGHALAGGQFCTQCGTPVPLDPAGGEATQAFPMVTGPVHPDEPGDRWRSDTAERPAVDAGATRPHSPLPPPPATAGDGPRYPLFADQTDPVPPQQTAQQHPSPVLAPSPPVLAPEPYDDSAEYGNRRWVPWVAGAAAVLLVAVLGLWLVGGDDSGPITAPNVVGDGGGSHTGAGTGGGTGGGTDVAREATAQVPQTAPPNQDLDGNMVRYDARNMLDGVPTTCWRMAGDGTGQEVVFDLAGPTTLTQVGLINGYAKTATDARGHQLDWYHGNRRVLSVQWIFDDGTTVSQDLTDNPRMQTVDVDHVTTSAVRLRLVTVSPPGRGPAARDYTPISDVTLVGARG